MSHHVTLCHITSHPPSPLHPPQPLPSPLFPSQSLSSPPPIQAYKPFVVQDCIPLGAAALHTFDTYNKEQQNASCSFLHPKTHLICCFLLILVVFAIFHIFRPCLPLVYLGIPLTSFPAPCMNFLRVQAFKGDHQKNNYIHNLLFFLNSSGLPIFIFLGP